MKIHLRLPGAALAFAASSLFVHATQETVIVREARLYGERALAQGYQCRTQVHPAAGKNFDVPLELDKNLLYKIALVTGYGEKAMHPSRVTLITQENKSIPLEFQNTPFGSELKLHPLSTGQKILKFDMTAKTEYSVVVCANYASLYHTGEKDRVIDDHSHF
jgi:hypothetical protein